MTELENRPERYSVGKYTCEDVAAAINQMTRIYMQEGDPLKIIAEIQKAENES